TMTSLNFVSYLTFLCLWTPTTTDNLSVRQESGFVSARVGDSVTLRCFYEGDISALFFWYKQTLGMKPRLISTLFKYVYISFSDEFQNNPNVTLETNNKSNHLTISNLRILDSATYFCVSHYKYKTIFCEGTTVSVKGSGLNVPVLVHQSASETIQPGGSVTLNCTVHTGTCDGQHSVYWFKDSEESHPGLIYTHGGRNDQSSETIQPGGSVTLNCTVHTGTCDGQHSVNWFKDSEESHPGLIYTHGGRNDQCERKPSTQTHTCSYNLPMTLSDAGTYYCVVASCGRVLFGDGTKLDFEGEEDPLFLVYFLSGALLFAAILVVLLGFSVYKVNKKNSCQYSESHGRLSAPPTANTEGYENADSPHYAAFSINPPNETRRQRNNTNVECVYSGVKQ
uniref:Ig-like domain-containing protein n=1 Tax=Cyclopterus lumpus TaxID=8103 RepID=A0A8C3G0J6_CYCLU